VRCIHGTKLPRVRLRRPLEVRTAGWNKIGKLSSSAPQLQLRFRHRSRLYSSVIAKEPRSCEHADWWKGARRQQIQRPMNGGTACFIRLIEVLAGGLRAVDFSTIKQTFSFDCFWSNSGRFAPASAPVPPQPRPVGHPRQIRRLRRQSPLASFLYHQL
jgi:hypothetical protein